MTTPQPTLSFSREIFAKLSPHPYLLAHLQPPSHTTTPTRANGRLPSQFRAPHINTSSLTHAEGSAVVRVGDTTAVCGVRGEILLASDVAGYRVSDGSDVDPNPYRNEAQDLDLLVPNVELATGCSPLFLPGAPPSSLAQSLATRIYSLLHSSRLVDVEDLKIWYQPLGVERSGEVGKDDKEEEEEVKPEVMAFWTLYIDVWFMSLDGNPFDVAWAAVLSALKDVRLPKAYWDIDREMILCSEDRELSKKLPLRGLPIASTFVIFKVKEQGQIKDGKNRKSWLLADPDTFEESLCEETITVVVDRSDDPTTRVLGISKSGGTVVGRSEMEDVMKLALTRWAEWHELMEGGNLT